MLVLGMREMQGFLERWQLDAGDLRRRMYWAPTPREREGWHALWLLVQGWTAVAVAEALGRDAHTIGRWVAVFGEGGPGAMAFEQLGGSPRDRRSAADRTEGSGAGVSSKGWPRLGQLELECGAQICAGTFRGLPKPQQLPELPPSTRGQALRGKWVLKGEPPWWTRPARAGAKRPAIIRRCAWKPARWNGWNWRATATLQPPPLSCGN